MVRFGKEATKNFYLKHEPDGSTITRWEKSLLLILRFGNNDMKFIVINDDDTDELEMVKTLDEPTDVLES
jgi:hypothetical protein